MKVSKALMFVGMCIGLSLIPLNQTESRCYLFASVADTPSQKADLELAVLTTISQVRKLSPEEADRHYPVRLKGVVTFINAAQEILTRFLQSNPDSQAFFYDHNVIIYDGHKDFAEAPVTVQVWEFDSGATIAIVGHADNPAIHA